MDTQLSWRQQGNEILHQLFRLCGTYVVINWSVIDILIAD